VGFQVVLIVGQADVVVPENLSAAANYNCVDCVAYALASQLVLTLDGPLSQDSLARLNALWAEIADYGRNLRDVPLSEIQDRLAAYKDRITAIVQADPGATRSAEPAATDPATTAPAGTRAPGADPAATAPATQPAGGPAPAGTAPATAPAAVPTEGDAPPSYSPIETPPPTADTGGTAPAVQPPPTGNPT
jgi:putative peptide zinc metalloprotease protein